MKKKINSVLYILILFLFLVSCNSNDYIISDLEKLEKLSSEDVKSSLLESESSFTSSDSIFLSENINDNSSINSSADFSSDLALTSESYSNDDNDSKISSNENISEKKGIWISYFELYSLLNDSSKEVFHNKFSLMMNNISKDGFNTIFVHVRSHSDAFYDSAIFPWSKYCKGTEGLNPGYDPLEIIIECAHKYNIDVEAWINPYRVSNKSDFSDVSEKNPAYSWKNTGKVKCLSDGIYYNPCYDEVIDLIVDGVVELVSNYQIDGIHFDDYFYPSQSTDFDNFEYQNYISGGGELDLFSWRRENINKMIKKVYRSIKSINQSCSFGVSPSGNMDYNYNYQYCDIEKWVSSSGYVDYICPQIYWGFEHSFSPFLTILSSFSDMITNPSIKLYVGLAAYKIGTKDGNSDEWINDGSILAKEVSDSRLTKQYGGFALYSYSSIYDPQENLSKYVAIEFDNLKQIMKEGVSNEEIK